MPDWGRPLPPLLLLVLDACLLVKTQIGVYDSTIERLWQQHQPIRQHLNLLLLRLDAV